MLAEVLNSIFDIFAEAHNNDIVTELHLLEQLKAALLFLTQMVWLHAFEYPTDSSR